jgi:ABC-type uncharacterized transport system permease subunit
VTSAASGAEAAELPPRTWFDRVYAAIPLATVFVALLALYAWDTARGAASRSSGRRSTPG